MKLALGTAQFGMAYGITNTAGRPTEAEIKAVLAAAAENGVNLLDTAPEYGDAEDLLGRVLDDEVEANPSPVIVTKVPRMSGIERNAIGGAVRQAFEKSLTSLRRSRTYGLLIHHCDDLLSLAGPEIYAALVRLKNDGLVEKIGVSVYDAAQIDAVVERYDFDLVQLPLNVLDQRLVESGHLSSLHRAGIEIHVRSAFLQGLLLMAPDELPHYLSALKNKLADYSRTLDTQNLSPVTGALGFLRMTPEIDRVLVGVQSVRELKEVSTAFAAANVASVDYARFACNDDALVNPARWPLS